MNTSEMLADRYTVQELYDRIEVTIDRGYQNRLREAIDLKNQPNAYEELMDYLLEDECVEAIVFGQWGGEKPDEGYCLVEGEVDDIYDPSDSPHVPLSFRGKPLGINEARSMMQGWRFSGGMGSITCYAVYVWTNHRVIWVNGYDGATSLRSAPISPIHSMPTI